MALDPRLSLAVQPNIGNTFQNALLNVQGVETLQRQREQAPLQNRLLEAQVGGAEAQQQQQQQANRFQSIAFGAAEILPDLKSGNFEGANLKLQARRANLIQQGLPTEATDNAINLLSTDPSQLLNRTNEVIQIAQQRGILKAPTAASTRSSAPITDPVTGQVSIPTFNPATNTVELLPVEGAIQLTPQQKVDLEIEQAQGKATATQRASRISDITREMSERNRSARRGAINLSQAATLIDQAEQGVAGASKVRLAKLFPGIDVSSEAALSQSLTNLALDELQKFKGPTTDFEFQKTEQIAGTLGDSKTANKAKVASLQRANWFTQRESRQFNDWIKAGKNPDTFGFDFGEQIKTKKGNFSLQDLQDTAVSNNISIQETIKRLDK